MNKTPAPISFAEKFDCFTEQWSPKVVAEMNDYQFKLVRIEGDFVWSDGTPVGYTNWNSSEPNNSGGNEDCGQLNRFNENNSNEPGTWNDEPCNTGMPFICEVNP